MVWSLSLGAGKTGSLYRAGSLLWHMTTVQSTLNKIRAMTAMVLLTGTVVSALAQVLTTEKNKHALWLSASLDALGDQESVMIFCSDSSKAQQGQCCAAAEYA